MASIRPRLIRLEMVNPCVEAWEFRGVPVIGTVGRLNEVKRQDLLIHGFANIANRDPKPHLLLVGDGPELESLRGMAALSDLPIGFISPAIKPGPSISCT